MNRPNSISWTIACNLIMCLTVYRLYVYFVESHCKKSVRVSSSICTHKTCIMMYLFYFILGRIVTGDIKRLVACAFSLACGIATLCIRTVCTYAHTAADGFWFSAVHTENVVIARESRHVHTFIYRIFLLSHAEQDKLIAYRARFRGTFRDSAVLRTAVCLLRSTSWGLNATNCNNADHTNCGDRPVFIGGMSWSLNTGVRYW
jgi:hypothetical protein